VRSAGADGDKTVDGEHDTADMTTVVLMAPARQKAGSSICMERFPLG
jgi:hypothetical protein